MFRKYCLGIDIGSVSIALAWLDDTLQIVDTAYAFHGGQLTENLSALLRKLPIQKIGAIACTSSTPAMLRQAKVVDSRIAYITAARHFHPGLQALLILGAEKFGMATFGKDGAYLNYRSNTSCAAGTGNFLDQQVERLNLKNIQAFCETACSNRGSFPLIASRCAVFAKTDLIHAQQEGYTLREICDGLSYGLARNIIDAVSMDNSVSPLVAAGGVALNRAVIRHIEKLTGVPVTVDDHAPVYGAIGAAIVCSETVSPPRHFGDVHDILLVQKKSRSYFYPPLQLSLSEYPDFDRIEKYPFYSRCFPAVKPVETELYAVPDIAGDVKVFLGVDIGSTSTKAVLMDADEKVVAGFYTRTGGQPLQAVMVIFEAIRDLEQKRGWRFSIRGAGTTGSGRRFTGKIIGADLMLDEITAHARAAYKLDPETDTIIEIGGQDSKFTTMQDGVVTFSVMNNVCAAGTGSFIEEQAKKLGCSLDGYSERAEKACAPITSDRCTVYMERDLNHYLNAGYAVDELLAAVLHATRDNYLSKVAASGSIGRKIFFQGATAKNKALVAAFEQKLKKPIMVSRFCHLTGAYGVALCLKEQHGESVFRGLDLYLENIPVQSETCQLCTNHCKLKVAEIGGEVVACGFLCGRDYHEKKYVKNKTSGFDLIRKRQELFKANAYPLKSSVIIGIPAGLHLFEEIPFWREFFGLLGIQTITSEDCMTVVKDGKNLCGAEFCAPLSAMHAHVEYLKARTDYIFLPTYLSAHLSSKTSKQYCYYTQFVASVVSVHKRFQPRENILTPLLKSSQGEVHDRIALYKMLRNIGIRDTGFLQVTMAYEKAKRRCRMLQKKWQDLYRKEANEHKDMHIMLLGRPYTVLSKAMNNHIPEIIEKFGVRTYAMDMIPMRPPEDSNAEELIRTIKWKFAADILDAAETVARTKGCYPVLLTSFKCTPDSFAIEYFKAVFNASKKPYLILQLDEHDSAIGYETRIEAGIRAFRNHFSGQWDDAGIPFSLEALDSQRIELLKDKTLLLPSWDQQVGPLLEAVLQNSGIDARLVNSSEDSMRRSLIHNTGQCIPLNIIVQNAIDYIEINKLDPANTVLWIIKSTLSCNLSMFPQYMKKLLGDYGNGMEQAHVYAGDLIYYDISLQTAIQAYLAYMFGGYIRKIGCKIRPYETTKGRTDSVILESFQQLRDTFRQGTEKTKVLERIIREFESIPVKKTPRPKVAIFGDLYVRDNEQMNQHLIKTIEENGGEAITTPYSEYIKMIIDPFIERAFREGRYLAYARTKFLKSLIPLVEEKYRPYFRMVTGVPVRDTSSEFDEWLDKFGLNLMHRGESFENILKIHKLVQQHPDIALFIQTNPSYCCPSLITEAMSPRIEEITGIPVVTIEYDGTSGFKNEDIIPYLKFGKARPAVQRTP